MRPQDSEVYVCPATGAPLRLVAETVDNGRVLSGRLETAGGACYSIRDGLPNLIHPAELPASDARALAYYEQSAEVYDRYLHLTFRTFGVDETEIRNSLIDGLKLTPHCMVLETGCGTGRDSALIARRLGPGGKLYVQDLSPAMLAKAVERLSDCPVPIGFALANGCYLPFPDDFFDAAYHMGGLNTFGDIGRALGEMTRVTRPGGKIVVGDEGLGPWLRDTEYGRILMNSNPNYRHEPPLQWLPFAARSVVLRWIMGGAFYALEYEVGEPQADFDFEIPGRRGGTHRTRLYGQLEGVAPEAKRLAEQAAERAGKSMHSWLTDLVLKAARAELRDLPPRE